MTAYPKTEYVRSKTLLEACREIPCQHCGAQDGTVCAAHSNQSIHGKGRGIKASDDCVAALCATCHAAIDQGSRLMRWEREEIWTRAHVKTRIELQARGQWPNVEANRPWPTGAEMTTDSAGQGPVERQVGPHTPGPWRWWACKDGSYDSQNDYAQIAAGTSHVAQVRIVSTTEADLRLMVAAPDLLAALNAMLTHLGMDEDEWNRPTFEQARRAVDKAVFVRPNVGANLRP